MATAQPTVSIITVVFNDRDALAQTMASVFGQTYPHIEFIIVDGGSTDGTVALIQEEAHRIGRWISEPDRGIYDGMNKGQRMATGDFVWFMNAGDCIYEAATLSQVFEAYQGEDILYGDAALVDGQYRYSGMRRHKRLPAQLSVHSMRLGMVVCHQSLLVRRSIAPPYDLAHPYSADIDWTIRALQQARSVRNTGLILSKFQRGGFSAQNRWPSWRDRFAILRKHLGLPRTLAAHLEIVAQSMFRPKT
jgi:glycosyltransferase involved in cell wall biosynthesis